VPAGEPLLRGTAPCACRARSCAMAAMARWGVGGAPARFRFTQRGAPILGSSCSPDFCRAFWGTGGAKHEHDAAIVRIDECVAEGILSAAGATEQCGGRDLNSRAPAAEAEPKRGRGRQVGSENTSLTGLDDLQDKTLCQMCKDLGLAWIDRAQAIAAIHLRSSKVAKNKPRRPEGGYTGADLRGQDFGFERQSCRADRTYPWKRRGEHLPAPAPKEQMQGVRGGEHLPAPSASGAHARSAGGRASASTSAKGADARSVRGRACVSTSAGGALARSAGGRASASTSASGAHARQVHAGVRAFVRAHPQELSPAPVLGKNSGVAH